MCAPDSKHAQKRLRWFVVCVSLPLHILLRVVLPEYNYVLTGRIPDYALSKWQEQGPVDYPMVNTTFLDVNVDPSEAVAAMLLCDALRFGSVLHGPSKFENHCFFVLFFCFQKEISKTCFWEALWAPGGAL